MVVDDEDKEDIRLKLELDRLIKKELDASELDVFQNADRSSSSISFHGFEGIVCNPLEDNPLLNDDFFRARNSYVESNHHSYPETSMDESRPVESLQPQPQFFQNFSSETYQIDENFNPFFLQRYPTSPNSGTHIAGSHGAVCQSEITSRQFYDLITRDCNETDVSNPSLESLATNRSYTNTTFKQPALSTSNLFVGEGLAPLQDHQHARSCTPIISDSTTPHHSSGLPMPPPGLVLSPQPDENASPARLSPFQNYCDNASVGVFPLPESNADFEERKRMCLIFEARGRQLLEAQQQITLVNEELAQCERLSYHKEIISKAEIENLTRELERVETLLRDAEKKVTELKEENSNLFNELSAMRLIKTEMEEKLANIEASNASLSVQLTQVSSGASLNLARQRENNLNECLTRRHAMAEDVLRENLEMVQRKIVDKDNELTSLRKDLELERVRTQELATKNAEFVESLQDKLKVAQDRCSELSSSSLCAEVHDLRQRIKDITTSKKITEDINEILQEELKDVREQIVLYEQTLGICTSRQNEVEYSATNDSVTTTPKHQLPFFHDTGGVVLSTIFSKPWSDRSRRRSYQSVKFATNVENCENGDALKGEEPQRPSSAVAAPLSSTWNHEVGVPEVASVSDDEMISTTPSRRSALGPAPGVSSTTVRDQTKDSVSSKTSESVSFLKAELKTALASYRAKRAQITSLHERLFTVRCDLHKAVAERDRAEAARADLQVRVLTLEKELNLHADISKPGPRESALTGQLERLQADYSRLESELQMTRSRLQDALAAEARAAVGERTARERLEASAAEREAAVERARAACEAHYTAARRRLEAQLNTEHERLLYQFKQEALLAREESTTYRNELEQASKSLQEAKEATAQAVQMTLAESMKERENERIRFWREELPRQIEQARRSWMHEAEARAALEADHVRASCQAEFETRIAACKKEHQVELIHLRRPKPSRDQAVECTSAASVKASPVPACPALAILTTDDLFAQLVSIPQTIPLLPLIEANLRSLLHKAACALVHQVSEVATKSLLMTISESGILKDCQIQLAEKLSLKEPFDPLVEAMLGMLGDLVRADLSTEIAIMRRLADGFAESAKVTTALDNKDVNTAPVANGIVNKIRGEVQAYVNSCQERYAMALQTGLVRAHRRACRQLSRHLHATLSESGSSYPSAPHDYARGSPTYSPMRLSEPQLESLFHIIDAACSSIEISFSGATLRGQSVFGSPSTSQTIPPNMPASDNQVKYAGDRTIKSKPRKLSLEKPVPAPRNRCSR